MSMTPNRNTSVPSPPTFAAASRVEKKIALNSGKTADEIREMDIARSQSFAEDFNPTSILRRLMDDAPTDRPEAQEDGGPLTEGSRRVLKLAQGESGLTADERARDRQTIHRSDLDHALDLAVQNAHTIHKLTGSVSIDADRAMKGSKLVEAFFRDGRRDFSADEREAMELAIDSATREVTLSDDPKANEALRRRLIAELQTTAIAIADNTATRAQRIRWSRFNVSRLLNLLKTTRWADLPLDLAKTF